MAHEEAVRLLESSREAVLATTEDGKPFASAVSYLYEAAVPGEKFGRLYLLMSSMARHTKNIVKQPQVSLMVLAPGSDYVYEKKRVSAQGTATPAAKEKYAELKTRYLKIYPSSEMLFSLPDFQFFEVSISELYFIGGFGKIQSLS